MSVSFVVISREVDCLVKFGTADGLRFAVNLYFFLVFHLELLDLLVKLAHAVLVSAARVADDRREALIFEAVGERGAKQLTFVEDFVLNHKLVKFVLEGRHVVLESSDQVLVPSGNLPSFKERSLISKDEITDTVFEKNRVLVVTLDEVFVMAFTID